PPAPPAARPRSLHDALPIIAGRSPNGSRLSVGGNPAAPSGTATLLRLSPSHRVHLRPLPPRGVGSRTSGALDFHGLTGGVYKARDRKSTRLNSSHVKISYAG